MGHGQYFECMKLLAVGSNLLEDSMIELSHGECGRLTQPTFFCKSL